MIQGEQRKYIGRVLRLVRQATLMSVTEVARHVDVHTSLLSEVERGERLAGLKLLEKWSEVMEVKLSTVFLAADLLEKNEGMLNGGPGKRRAILCLVLGEMQ